MYHTDFSKGNLTAILALIIIPVVLFWSTILLTMFLREVVLRKMIKKTLPKAISTGFVVVLLMGIVLITIFALCWIVNGDKFFFLLYPGLGLFILYLFSSFWYI